tara:strand:- start:79 stop:426 length:348 start_codon:yes stop_codon:yes gene_type:complete
MSETVHYKGQVIRVAEGLESSQEYAAKVLEDRNQTVSDYYNGHTISCLCDSYEEEFFFHEKKKNLYKIYSKEEIESNDEIMTAKVINEGVIEYELRYYNGGVGFEECLEEALNKL